MNKQAAHHMLALAASTLKKNQSNRCHDINILRQRTKSHGLNTSKGNREVISKSAETKTKKPLERTADLEGYQKLMKQLHFAKKSISIDQAIHCP